MQPTLSLYTSIANFQATPSQSSLWSGLEASYFLSAGNSAWYQYPTLPGMGPYAGASVGSNISKENTTELKRAIVEFIQKDVIAHLGAKVGELVRYIKKHRVFRTSSNDQVVCTQEPRTQHSEQLRNGKAE